MDRFSTTPYLPISDENMFDELFQISCDPHQHQQQQQLTILQKDGEVPECGRRPPESAAAFGVKDDDHMKPNESKRQKLIMHRDIERQRRREMATLYKSLKSLLPHEILKGKRSTSDQIQEAVNYIKRLEIKIEGLGDKRDGLKRSLLSNSSSSSSNYAFLEECSSDQLFIVMVEPCLVGIRVIINTKLGVPFSRFLHLLVGEELSVISYTSSKVNQRMLHSVDCQVSDGRSIDVSELQQKLTNSSVIPGKNLISIINPPFVLGQELCC
ncbi:transcription factor bHLH118-like [Tripterygium wilfordii]|uniref:transcription factor bHLH118-like n=1 Tax=Tripterygium wilfordii TaxID=458696 RepID=UPI0018F804F2|nr:transcription factor bHLH118-like [Tripterygium wilfordii]